MTFRLPARQPGQTRQRASTIGQSGTIVFAFTFAIARRRCRSSRRGRVRRSRSARPRGQGLSRPTLAQATRAVIAFGGLQDCCLQFPDTPERALRTAAVAGAIAALGLPGKD
jgi:hypothetical protein